jgi:hypothetical protein
MDLAQPDDLAVVNGEVLDDSHRAETVRVEVVEEHRFAVRAHRRQQFDVSH